MNECIVEGGEYAGDTENEFTWLHIRVLIIRVGGVCYY